MTYKEKKQLWPKEKSSNYDEQQLQRQERRIRIEIRPEPRWDQQFIINLRNAPPIIYSLESESDTQTSSENESEN